jgi:hypothetical protein
MQAVRRYAIATWHLFLSPVGFLVLIFVVLPTVVGPLASSGMSSGGRAVVAFYLGLLAGATWYRIHPKPFIDRVMGAALASAVVIPFLPFAGGFEVAWEPESALFPGVLVGLVLTEGWIERRLTGRPAGEQVSAER